jgi:hypothetical protein
VRCDACEWVRVAANQGDIAEAAAGHERDHEKGGTTAEIKVYRLPWLLPPPLFTYQEGEQVVGEACSSLTLVTLTNQRVLVTQPSTSHEWAYEEIDSVHGGFIGGHPGTSEDDPFWGLLIESRGLARAFKMSAAEARRAAEKIQRRIGAGRSVGEG